MAIYLDHNATTPLDEEVLEAMLPFLKEAFANPSSRHRHGQQVRLAVEAAREQVAALVNVRADQVIFTSGGTEANNLALRGLAHTMGAGRVLVSAIEHASVTETARALGRHGWAIGTVPVDPQGRVTASAVAEALTADTRILSVMSANNETGVVQDIQAIGAVAGAANVLLHSDAVQVAGKVPIDFNETGAQLMSLSAHKMYGPKGAGALVVDRALDIAPQMSGGGHERGFRSGTENVAAIVGFGAAAAKAKAELKARHDHLLKLRNRLEEALTRLPGVVIFAAGAGRLPNTVFFALKGVSGEATVMNLDVHGIAASSGSACGERHVGPSPVLDAMGVDRHLAQCAVRLSLGKDNSEADIVAVVSAVKAIADSAERLRPMLAAVS